MTRLNQPLQGTCYRSGQAPSSVPTGPGVVTEEWLLVSGSFPYLVFPPNSGALGAHLGEAEPAAALPRAIEGASNTWIGRRMVSRRGPSSASRTALESVTASWAIDLNLQSRSGTLTLTHDYSCTSLGTQPADQCPSQPVRPATCSVVFPLTLQALTQLPAWARLPAGAQGAFFFVTETSPQVASCYVANRVPDEQVTTGSIRRFELVTAEPHRLSFTSPWRVKLGDSPEFTFSQLNAPSESDRFSFSTSRTSQGPVHLQRTANEVRSGFVSTQFPPSGTGEIRLSSTYACVDQGAQPSQRCPTGAEAPAPDAVNCQVDWLYQAVEAR